MLSNLRLAAYVQVPIPGGVSCQAVTVSVEDGDQRVSIPVPMHEYGATGVVAAPTATLAGTVVSLDLNRWVLYDLEHNRPVGNLSVTTTDPGCPDVLRLVDRYIREARHLYPDELETWAAGLVGAIGGEQS